MDLITSVGCKCWVKILSDASEKGLSMGITEGVGVLVRFLDVVVCYYDMEGFCNNCTTCEEPDFLFN